MRMKLVNLGSGSGGNCTLVETERGTRLLIDAARLGVNYITDRLSERGVSLDDVSGTLATHMHGDHVDAGVTYPICRKHGIPLYVHSGSFEDLLRRSKKFAELDRAGLVRKFDDSPFAIGELTVAPFAVPHGSGGWNRDIVGRPVGFRISHIEGASRKSFAFATDLGEVTPEAEEAMLGADALAIECNHDVRSELDSGRPRFLVDWVLGGRGHLSNEQCGRTAARVASRSRGSVKRILLLHLSEDCNTPKMALDAVRESLRLVGEDHIPIDVAAQREPSAEIII